MSGYESDSSGSEDEFTETNVLLGYASKDNTDDAISQLGGHPTWLDGQTAPPGNLSKCKCCNGLLTLLLELNGDLPERFAGHERRLYLLGCRKKACRRKEGSIRGFRAMRASKTASTTKSTPSAPVATPAQEKKPQVDIGSSLFGVKPSTTSSSANPFSSSSGGSAMANPFASASSLAAKPAQTPVQPAPDTTANLSETFASKARISTTDTPPAAAGPSEPWPPLSSFSAPYPTYSLDADYETLDPSVLTIPANAQIDTEMELDDSTGASNSSGAEAIDKEVFESVMDRAFQKFADRMAQNPEQVLRYEFGGQPLLYSRDDAVGKILGGQQGAGKVQTLAKVPRCACGAERLFEVQLTPHAITELEAEELGIEGMEWGTVLLCVCSRDCAARGVGEGEVGYVEEWVGVQWEEQVSHGKGGRKK